MPWLSRKNFSASDKLHADDLNNLALDNETWGGDVNGGGWTLSNVHIIEAGARAAGQVTSVFGRIGDVTAMAGDYTAALVGAVPLTRQIITGNVATSGLSGGGPLSADLTLTAAVTSVFNRTGAISLTPTDIGTAGGVLKTQKINTAAGSGLSGGGVLSGDLSLAVLPDTTNQQIQVMSQGSPIGSPRHAINFVSGTGALITVSEISASNRIDVTVASTGTGGGMVDPTQVAGDLIVRGLTAPATRMPVGTDGQVLTADHLQALGVKWATPPVVNAVSSVFGRTGAILQVTGDYSASQITNAVDNSIGYVNPPWITSLPWSKITNPPAFMLDPTVAKGDLIVHGATTTRLPLGVDGAILTADSTLAAGVKWAGLPVTSVFGRTGAIVATAQDGYTVDMIAGAVSTATTINTPIGSGLQGGGNLSQNRTLSVVPDSVNQQIQVLLAGAVVGTRHAINFVNGANVSLSISDNVGTNRIDLTVSSTGGGGGMVDPTTGIGDLIVRGATAVQRLGVGLNGQVLTCDNTQALGVRWAVATGGGGSGSQSPWASDIDAANFNLNNAGGIGVNIASSKTVARVYAFINASEDGFRAKTNTAAGMAAASFINDIGDSVCIRSYGTGFVGGLPGLATLEASNVLALFANAAEVMRLKSGRVMIGTTTDDAVNMLQVNGKVKSKTGGFVFPDSTIQTTAYTAASSPVTSVFTRTGAVVQVVGDYSAAQVTNAVDSSSTYSNPSWISSLAWSKITGAPAIFVDPMTAKGDIITRGTAAGATRLGVGTNGQVLTADSAATLGVKWAAGAAQSPWLSDIDGAGFKLGNVSGISIGVPVTNIPLIVHEGTNQNVCLARSGGGANALQAINDTYASFVPLEYMASIHYFSQGWVGIGVPSPAQPLHVSGNALFTGGYSYLVDGNHGTQVTAGNGLTLFTYGVPNGISLQQVTGNVGISVSGASTNTIFMVRSWPADPGSMTPQGAAFIKSATLNGGSSVAAPEPALILSREGVGGQAYANFAQFKLSRYENTATQSRTRLDICLSHDIPGNPPDPTILSLLSGGQVHPPGGIWLAGGDLNNRVNGMTWYGLGMMNNSYGAQLACYAGLNLQSSGVQMYVHPSGGVGINTGFGSPNAGLAATVTGTCNIRMVYGATWGAMWYCDPSNFYLLLTNSGDPYGSWNNLRPFYVNFTTGNVVMGANLNVGNGLAVSGNVNSINGGVYQLNGLPCAAITSANNVTGSRVLTNVYQNNTGRPMFVSVYTQIAAGQYIKLLADSGNPPGYQIFATTNPAGVSIGGSVCGWVMPGYFYKLDTPPGGATLSAWAEWY